MNSMKVLIFCEESQRSCIAFREKGHEAYSCDLQKCSGGHPEWHIQGDGLRLLNGFCEFKTMDGLTHDCVCLSEWDLIIAHPPCTYLSRSGGCNLLTFYGKIKNQDRFLKGLTARDFFMQCLNASCKRIAVENPIPLAIFNLPGYTQIIQPWQFGDPYTKATCLWLKGLPELIPTHKLEDYESVSSFCLHHSTGKARSKTFNGIANAFSTQWTEDSKPLQINIFEVYDEAIITI